MPAARTRITKVSPFPSLPPGGEPRTASVSVCPQRRAGCSGQGCSAFVFFTNDLKLSRGKLAPLLFLTVNFSLWRQLPSWRGGGTDPRLFASVPFLFPGSPSFAAGGRRLPGNTLGLQFAPPRPGLAWPGPAARPAAFPSAGSAHQPRNIQSMLSAGGLPGGLPPSTGPEGADPGSGRCTPRSPREGTGAPRCRCSRSRAEDALAGKRPLR